MNVEELDALVGAARAQRAAMEQLPGVTLFDFWTASDEDLANAEFVLATRLPEQYKDFMRRYGGGQFLFMDILPVASPDGRAEDLLAVNRFSMADSGFVAVAPVGTGDWWGFVSNDGICEDRVCFRDHEDGHVENAASDFFEFVAHQGLRIA
ncbi:SMI1/KNR4 family protein [Micromonospora vinacea]|uniref:SMI1/KNR4 family protein n=1 Tax=Micromonospora vinacea TaxID=709878 RepID=UPI00344D4768